MHNANAEKRKQAFNEIYDSHYWGDENLSGAGSSLQATKVTREIISKIINDYNISSIVDVACGDFVWMPLVLDECDKTMKYTGCDIVESLTIKHKKDYPQYDFKPLDFVEEEIPEADLIICREALQHLRVNDIIKALQNFSGSKSHYLLATIHLRKHGIRNMLNKRTGRCKDRNLLLSPFNLPNPLVIYPDTDTGQDKFLGLWKLPLWDK